MPEPANDVAPAQQRTSGTVPEFWKYFLKSGTVPEFWKYLQRKLALGTRGNYVRWARWSRRCMLRSVSQTTPATMGTATAIATSAFGTQPKTFAPLIE